MTRWANRLLLFVNVIVLVIGIFYFGWKPLHEGHDGIEYKDLVTIILTALAVILGAVTVFVAVMAIWGYNSIREESVKAAITAAEKEAKNTAQVVASREAVAMLGVLRGAGKPEGEDELAAALTAGDAPAGKSRRRANSVRRRASPSKPGGAGQ